MGLLPPLRTDVRRRGAGHETREQGRHRPFEAIIEEVKKAKGVRLDNELDVDDLKTLVVRFKEAVKKQTGQEFPSCAYEQLWGAICAVFDSWMNERAILYRKMEGIPAEWGTA